MDNDCSNNRGFVCEHGDDLTCSSPSHHQQVLESLWADSSHRPSFHDPSSSSPPTAYFDMPAPLHRNTRRRPRGRPVIHNINEEHNELVPEETNTNPEANCSYESSSQVISGKKRRLTAEQVQFLERSFELENKLDPDRKSRLARELGLEPRQVAIWFQNRRARFKTKSIEKEFDGLRNRYDKLKDEYETVLKENEQLQDQVSVLTAKLKRTKTSDSTPSPLHNNYTNTHAAIAHLTPVVLFKSAKVKQEEAATSAKSDVLDSDSSPPRCSGGDGVAAKCNYYNNYYYNSSSPVPEMVEEEESEEFQLTRSLFPPAPPPAPYDGFHRQDGGCNGFGMSTAGVDVEVEPRPSSLWPWLY